MTDLQLSKAVEQLRSNSFNSVFNALVELSKLCKKNCLPGKRLVALKGTEAILPLIEKPKLADISLSILANCCLDDDFRKEVLKKDAVSSIVRVLSCLAKESLLNRACRALANISLSHQGAEEVYQKNALPYIVQMVSSSNSSECQITAVRALRILSKMAKCRQKIIILKGVSAVSELLGSTDATLKKNSIQALAYMTQQCSPKCIEQVKTEGLKYLVALASDADTTIAEHALITIINLSVHEQVRIELLNAGFLPVLVAHLQEPKLSKPSFSHLFSTLCIFSHNASTDKIQDLGGVPLLIDVLKDETHEALWLSSIRTLIGFQYDEDTMMTLLDKNIVSVVANHLEKYTEANKVEHSFDSESQNGLQKSSACCSVSKQSKFENLENGFSWKDDEFQEEEDHEDSSSEVENITTKNTSTLKVFCIHSPSYQEIQHEKALSGFDCFSVDSGYSTNSASSSSPDINALPFMSPRSIGSPSSPSNDYFVSPLGSPVYSSGNDSPVTIDPCSPDQFTCYSPVCVAEGDSCSSEVDSSDTASKANNLQELSVSVDVSKGETSSLTSDRAHVTETSISLSEGGKKSVSEVDKSHDLESADKIVKSSSESSGQQLKNGSEVLESVTLPNSTDVDCETSEVSQNMKRLRTCSISDSESEEHPSKRLRRISDASVCSGTLDPQDEFIYCLIKLLRAFLYTKTTKLHNSLYDAVPVLLNYVAEITSPVSKAEQTLLQLISNVHLFETVLLAGSVLKFEEQLKQEHSASCKKCIHLVSLKRKLLDKLTSVAEGGYGSGVLAHVLITGSSEQQQVCILSLPHIVRDKPLLKQLLVGCGGLDLLLDLLEKASDKTDFLQALNSLSCIFKVLYPFEKEKSSLELHSLQPCVLKPKKELYDAYFQLDSGETAYGIKNVLCSKSGYFKAMFEGSFLEQKSSIVKIPRTSLKALNVVLHHLHGCNISTCPETSFSSEDLKVLDLSHLMMLPDLQDCIEKRILKNVDSELAPNAYSRALMYNSCDFKRALTRYIFSSDMTPEERFKTTQCLFTVSEKARVLDDISKLVQDGLGPY